MNYDQINPTEAEMLRTIANLLLAVLATRPSIPKVVQAIEGSGRVAGLTEVLEGVRFGLYRGA